MKTVLAKILYATSLTALAVSAWAQTVTTIATGLNGPRGLTLGPDGALYVAEAGTGGPNPPCEVVPVVGPYHGGPTATVSRISPDGERTIVVSGLPSALSSLPSGDTNGASDVAFLGDNLYVLVAGGMLTRQSGRPCWNRSRKGPQGNVGLYRGSVRLPHGESRCQS